MAVFCQGNKDQLTAAATYQHSEPECKLALMQMSHVFRGKTDCRYTNPPKHNTLLSLRYQNPPNPTLLPSCTESHSHRHFQGNSLVQSEGSVITRDDIVFSLHSRQKARVQWALCTNTHKQTGIFKKNTLTYPSWRRLANTDSLKLLFSRLHTGGNGRGQGASVTTPVYKRE